MGVENQATLGIGTALGHASHCSAVTGEEGRGGVGKDRERKRPSGRRNEIRGEIGRREEDEKRQ